MATHRPIRLQEVIVLIVRLGLCAAISQPPPYPLAVIGTHFGIQILSAAKYSADARTHSVPINPAVQGQRPPYGKDNRSLHQYYYANKLGVSEPPPEWFGNSPNVCKESWTNKNWLKSRFHFSFAEYSNPGNQNFGVLRVMNDDLVQPDRGFGAHPHRDVEICTYIVHGHLTHKDSMGTAETLMRGAVQFMTAGSGVTHSEHNLDKDKPLRFIQIWISTRQRGLKPNYGSSLGSIEERTNRFAHLVTDVQNTASSAPIKINQDANIYVSEISSGKSVEFVVNENRQAYLLCVEGGVKAQSSDGGADVSLAQHDAAEIRGGPSTTLTFTPLPTSATDSAHILVVEMALDKNSGRKDF